MPDDAQPASGAAHPESRAHRALRENPPQGTGPERFVCVHGHFYQPPRENPWLETVEVQDSAAPYHDWNERITAECYAPNGASRILNHDREIVRIINNYARISFNFGPTLLSWLAEFAPRVYRKVLEADRASSQRFGGYGSAMAQAYNHLILPLANERDARTQIRWGIADFQSRFGRRPEGMWLPETAVNRATLDLLAQEGIRFTVLAPSQCARVRPLPIAGKPEPAWHDTPNATVDTTQPYSVPLDNGRSIAVFFYDGPAARAVAFEGLLNNGEDFARRITSAFHDKPTPGLPPRSAQLAHIATDGESYGHHHRHGEMALSYALHTIAEQRLGQTTNYAEFLHRFPPTAQAEVVENTSWSCAHGIERWRAACGCNTGGRPGWNQSWRAPLRQALDWLRDAIAPLSEAAAKPFFKDLWQARDAYIQIILDRSDESVARFFAAQSARELTPDERTRALELMELQRHAQLMFTSCGWFFDEVSGIETVQIIAYAGRVLQLAARLFAAAGSVLEPEFLNRLALAKSNLPEFGDAAQVFRRYVQPLFLDLEKVGAHYAISSIFRSYEEEGHIFCFNVRRLAYEMQNSGRGRVAWGRARIHSRITEESEEVCFAVLHLGDQNLSAAVRAYRPEDAPALDEFAAQARAATRRANIPEIIRLMDSFFGGTAYSLTSLFADEQHRILRSILDTTLSEIERDMRAIYEDHASLVHFLTESNMPKPPALELAARFAINSSLRAALNGGAFNPERFQMLLERATADQIQLDEPVLAYAAGQRMKRALVKLELPQDGGELITDLDDAIQLAENLRCLPFELNYWPAQNIWNDLLRRAAGGEKWSPEWRDKYRRLGHLLHIAVEELVVEEGVTGL